MPKNLAETIVNTSLRVKPDETVVINTWQHTLPLASQLAYQVRKTGALPLVTLDTDELWWKSLTELTADNLRKPLRHNLAMLDETDAAINIYGPEDPQTYTRVQGPQLGAMFDSFQTAQDKIRENKIRSANILTGYITEPRARTYRFNYQDWKSSMEDAGNADYEKISQLGKRLARTLEHAKRVELTADGTKMEMQIGAHPVFVEDGIIDEEDRTKGFLETSIPTGYVTLAPKRGTTEGSVQFDLPTPILGTTIRGIKWEIQNGRLVKGEAEANYDAFDKMYDNASGDRDQVASLTIGLNPAAKLGYLTDNLAQGIVSVGLGENRMISGENQTSFQFQASLSKATVTVDGDPLVHKGKLMI